MLIDLLAQVNYMKRHLGTIERTLPTLVANGDVSRESAEHQIRCATAVLHTLQGLLDNRKGVRI